MRRLVMLVGAPLLLLVLWGSGEAAPDRGEVAVEIESADVAASRGAVISRMAGIGGVRVGEDTSFDRSEATSSELTFDIAVMRIEEALAELADVGGEVTSTRLDIGSASADARSVDDSLGKVQTCLSRVADGLAEGTATATENLRACESDVRSLNERVSGVGSPLETATLSVRISPRSGGSIALFWAVGVLAIVLATMAYLVLRSAREDDLIDLNDPGLTGFDAEMRLRRN